jgi:hypothetical protein
MTAKYGIYGTYVSWCVVGGRARVPRPTGSGHRGLETEPPKQSQGPNKGLLATGHYSNTSRIREQMFERNLKHCAKNQSTRGDDDASAM